MYVKISCSIPIFNKKKVYTLHMAGYNNEFKNIISVVPRMFDCSLHFCGGFILLGYIKGFKRWLCLHFRQAFLGVRPIFIK